MSALKKAFGLALGRRLPITQGTLKIPALQEPVTIHRDGFGIPHIEATNEIDGVFGLGFCHAQDRGFQMELYRRLMRGELAAIIGKDSLQTDRFTRRIGFLQAAEKTLPTLDSLTRAGLESYARGVNAGIDHGRTRQPHELVLLRAKMQHWNAADVVGLVMTFSMALGSGLDTELARMQILQADGPEALRAIEPVYGDSSIVTTPPGTLAGETVAKLEDDLEHCRAALGLTGGFSNNWVISGSRTRSGQPIVANDPHLPPTLPGHFYLSHIKSPEWNAVGAGIPGTPVIAAGHNGHVAWGVTSGLMDQADLFFEEIGTDGCSVRQGDEFVPCTVREERIEVKGGDTVVERVIQTPRGPVIGPAVEGAPASLSLRATWTLPQPFKGTPHAVREKTFDSFFAQFEPQPMIGTNTVLADTEGTIGWWLTGRAPVRKRGNGMLPQPGWDDAFGWADENVPLAQMPHVKNPENGFIGTANNKPRVDSDEYPYLGSEWLDGFRVNRIYSLLSERSDWDLNSVNDMQLDTVSTQWLEMREGLANVPRDLPGARRALELLDGFDGDLSITSSAATVFEFFIDRLAHRVATVKAPKTFEWVRGKGFNELIEHSMFGFRGGKNLVHLVVDQPEGFLPKPWPQELAEILDGVIAELTAKFGSDTSAWAWGKVRQLELKHPVADQAKPLARIFNVGPFPVGGDAEVIAQCAVERGHPLDNPIVIAGLRISIEVGDWDNAQFMLAAGQSGNPYSPHYCDMTPYWLKARGVTIPYSPEAVKKATRQTLELKPSTVAT